MPSRFLTQPSVPLKLSREGESSIPTLDDLLGIRLNELLTHPGSGRSSPSIVPVYNTSSSSHVLPPLSKFVQQHFGIDNNKDVSNRKDNNSINNNFIFVNQHDGLHSLPPSPGALSSSSSCTSSSASPQHYLESTYGARDQSASDSQASSPRESPNPFSNIDDLLGNYFNSCESTPCASPSPPSAQLDTMLPSTVPTDIFHERPSTTPSRDMFLSGTDDASPFASTCNSPVPDFSFDSASGGVPPPPAPLTSDLPSDLLPPAPQASPVDFMLERSSTQLGFTPVKSQLDDLPPLSAIEDESPKKAAPSILRRGQASTSACTKIPKVRGRKKGSTKAGKVGRGRKATEALSATGITDKRLLHNISERQRRADLKSNLDVLRCAIPEIAQQPRIHTSQILSTAISYIRALKEEDAVSQEKLRYLRAENARLRSGLATL
eukprot:m.9661 g.9661  ORF g.9661 m.9661 type:complete len:436 (-) comp7239_c1_seq1:142-1449(-)